QIHIEAFIQSCKKTDRTLSRVFYRTSVVLCLIENILKSVYMSKPSEAEYEAYQVWSMIKISLRNVKILLLNSLSYINKARQDNTIKIISPDYNLANENEKVFNQDLRSLIENKNAMNNFINQAFRFKNHTLFNRSST
ncbi:14_t:CDS:1, partial [Racocetra persica]